MATTTYDIRKGMWSILAVLIRPMCTSVMPENFQGKINRLCTEAQLSSDIPKMIRALY